MDQKTYDPDDWSDIALMMKIRIQSKYLFNFEGYIQDQATDITKYYNSLYQFIIFLCIFSALLLSHFFGNHRNTDSIDLHKKIDLIDRNIWILLIS